MCSLFCRHWTGSSFIVKNVAWYQWFVNWAEIQLLLVCLCAFVWKILWVAAIGNNLCDLTLSLQFYLKKFRILPLPGLISERCDAKNVSVLLQLFNQPKNCEKLFQEWKCLLEKLDELYNTNIRLMSSFLKKLFHLVVSAMPIYLNGRYSTQPIALAYFWDVCITTSNKPNVAYLPVLDAIFEPIVIIKALILLTAGS